MTTTYHSWNSVDGNTKRTVPAQPSDATAAFEAFAARFDTLGNEWQDMGANEYFEAGFKAATQPIKQGEQQ